MAAARWAACLPVRQQARAAVTRLPLRVQTGIPGARRALRSGRGLGVLSLGSSPSARCPRAALGSPGNFGRNSPALRPARNPTPKLKCQWPFAHAAPWATGHGPPTTIARGVVRTLRRLGPARVNPRASGTLTDPTLRRMRECASKTGSNGAARDAGLQGKPPSGSPRARVCSLRPDPGHAQRLALLGVSRGGISTEAFGCLSRMLACCRGLPWVHVTDREAEDFRASSQPERTLRGRHAWHSSAQRAVLRS